MTDFDYCVLKSLLRGVIMFRVQFSEGQLVAQWLWHSIVTGEDEGAIPAVDSWSLMRFELVVFSALHCSVCFPRFLVTFKTYIVSSFFSCVHDLSCRTSFPNNRNL